MNDAAIQRSVRILLFECLQVRIVKRECEVRDEREVSETGGESLYLKRKDLAVPPLAYRVPTKIIIRSRKSRSLFQQRLECATAFVDCLSSQCT